jgi:Rieske Fe-S protein
MPPQPGDHFVFLIGPKKGSIVHAADLPVGGPQVQAYPADPSGVVRNALRLNLILLIRLDPASMSDDTAGRAADGVVAYSGVCTHQGCPVNMWSTDRNAFVCSCHGSIYNPRDSATVMFGPAPKQLPALPLKTENGVLLVASGFTAKVGAAQV